MEDSFLIYGYLASGAFDGLNWNNLNLAHVRKILSASIADIEVHGVKSRLIFEDCHAGSFEVFLRIGFLFIILKQLSPRPTTFQCTFLRK